MEQKWFKKHEDFKNLRFCIDNYEITELYIRYVGSLGGKNVLLEKFTSEEYLNFVVEKDGLYLYKEDEEGFKPLHYFPLAFFHKGFSIQYLDEEKLNDVKVNPACSRLRICIDDWLMEIDFKGEIKIEKDEIWYDNTFYYKPIKGEEK